MIRYIITTALCFLFLNPDIAKAQAGDQVGLRFGSTNSLLYKHYVDENRALEARMGMNRKDRVIKLIFQYEQPASLLYRDKLLFYYGFGIHSGFQKNETYQNNVSLPGFGLNRYYPSLGFDAVIGSEYRLSSLPISVGVDFNPSFEIFAPFSFWRRLLDFGFTCKYTI